MAHSDVRWRHHFREFRWGLITGPFATPVYLCLALVASILVSAAIGVNGILCAIIGVGLTIWLQPKQRLLRTKNREIAP